MSLRRKLEKGHHDLCKDYKIVSKVDLQNRYHVLNGGWFGGDKNLFLNCPKAGFENSNTQTNTDTDTDTNTNTQTNTDTDTKTDTNTDTDTNTNTVTTNTDTINTDRDTRTQVF